MRKHHLNKSDKNTEQTVIKLLGKKDKSAITLAYENYGANLYGVILNILHNEEDAQEVLQDTFVKIWKNADSYNPKKGKLYTWMINIARRTAIDKTRTAAFKARKRTGTLGSFEDRVVPPKDLQEIVETNGIQKMLNSIEEKYRVIINLVYYQGYTMEEVHKKLDIPLGTVKSRIRLALIQFRKNLDKNSIKTD